MKIPIKIKLNLKRPPLKLMVPGLLFLLLFGVGIVHFSRSKPVPVQGKKEEPGQKTVSSFLEGEVARDLAGWMIHKGNEDLLSHRHSLALRRWELAHYLDAKNRLAPVKLERGRKILEKEIEKEYTQGLYAFKFLHFDQAIEHWQRVLQYITDPEHPRYQEAQNGIRQAKQKLKEYR